MNLIQIDVQRTIQRCINIGDEQKAQVIVKVCGLIFSRRDRMDINIEQIIVIRLRDESREPGFFRHLTLCSGAPRCVGVFDMAARLQPAIEFAMVNQRRMRARAVEHPGGCGQVTCKRHAAPWASLADNEIQYIFRMARGIC